MATQLLRRTTAAALIIGYVALAAAASPAYAKATGDDTVTSNVPSFAREMKDKDLWSKPVSARFHFRLKDGALIEVSQPTPELK